MIRMKKASKKTCSCYNCGYQVMISPDSVKEKHFCIEDAILLATYVQCPVCGEKILKQIDTSETSELATKGVKLELIQRRGKKLSEKQKNRLKSIEKMLSNIRKQINKTYWDEIYQLLNRDEEEKTGMADREPMPGNEVTNAGKLGERTV